MRSRQQAFIGKEKQEILEKSTIAVVGLGGTGHAAAEYLARAGIKLILVDNDVVERCNLGRQAYGIDDIGRLKVVVMKERLSPFVNVETHAEMLSSYNIDKFLQKAGIILDGTDNFEARFVVNDYCIKKKKPFTYAAAIRAESSFMFWLPGRPCLRCVFSGKAANDSCEKDGILSPVAAFVGTLSAIEAIKYLVGEKPLEGLASFDFFGNKFETVKTRKDGKCMCNGQEEI
ncbi:MAG: HesA/MoeB/ThiF family protein [Candidatus Aenigmarchaeota archaeon]|nr:HesA/MoeB/ThiF family protein [Candidatus Aenigmarchaeota archaeon]